MSDLILNDQGDLQIYKKSEDAQNDGVTQAAEYELAITNDYIGDLIKRTLMTPIGHITIIEYQDSKLVLKDNNYGSFLYRELSEGLTLNFLSRVKSHILRSLTTAGLQTNLQNVQVGLATPSSIQIQIIYSDNTAPTFLEIDIT